MSDKVKYSVQDMINVLTDFLKPENSYNGYITDVMMDDLLNDMAIPCESFAPYDALPE